MKKYGVSVMIKNFDELRIKVKEGQPQTIVVAGAHDEKVLSAVSLAYDNGIINAILIGDEEKIVEISNRLKIDLSNFKVINEKDPVKFSELAIELVKNKEADLPMKGLVETSTILKALLNKKFNMLEGNTLTHVAVIKVDSYDRFILLSDSAMLIEPTVEQKVEMVNYNTRISRILGNNKPKIALISSSEKVNNKQKSSYEAAMITEIFERDEESDAIVYGPLALDNAISEEAAELKGVKSEVAGNADIFIMPNIETANVFNKTLEYFAHADKAGVIVGGKVPLILTSRASSDESKLNSIALATYIVQNSKKDI